MRHAPTAALSHAIATALPRIPTFTSSTTPPAQQGATPRNTAQQNRPPAQNEPTPTPCTRYLPSRPLKPIQRTAARLLLLGHPTSVVAQTLRIHPYTLSRWKRNPHFQSEIDHLLTLHLTLDHDDQPPTPAQQGATPRNNAQQKHAPAQNDPPRHPRPSPRSMSSVSSVAEHSSPSIDNGPRTKDNPPPLYTPPPAHTLHPFPYRKPTFSSDNGQERAP